MSRNPLIVAADLSDLDAAERLAERLAGVVAFMKVGLELFEIKTVVENVANPLSEVTLDDGRSKYDPEAQVGDEILIKLDTATMGRIAAQAAKQNLIQHIRDAERKQIFNEFKDRRGEVVSGIVQRFERKNMIVNLGRTEAILPEKEQIPHERYRQGDRIRALILDVDLSEKGLSSPADLTGRVELSGRVPEPAHRRG